MKKRKHKLSGSEIREERSEKYGCDGYCTWFDPEEDQEYVCGMFDECEENTLDHLITNIILTLFMMVCVIGAIGLILSPVLIMVLIILEYCR